MGHLFQSAFDLDTFVDHGAEGGGDEAFFGADLDAHFGEVEGVFFLCPDGFGGDVVFDDDGGVHGCEVDDGYVGECPLQGFEDQAAAVGGDELVDRFWGLRLFAVDRGPGFFLESG